jgi:hypothetical protein
MSTRDEPPYDPYIPSAGGGPGAGGQGQNGNHRTAALQAVRHHLHFPREQRATATIACRKAAVIDAVAGAWLGTACITHAIATAPADAPLCTHANLETCLRVAQLDFTDMCDHIADSYARKSTAPSASCGTTSTRSRSEERA